jgi:hypothetical protein
MNTSNPNPISGRIIQKICALKEFWVEPGLFLRYSMDGRFRR